MRLLIVEDNQRLALLIKDGLERRGFAGDIAYTLGEAAHMLSLTDYASLILDLGLPDGNGVSWLSEMREKGLLLPALMLTGRDGLEDKVNGLNAGADDYVIKPVNMDELVARIRALLRRPGPRALSILEAGRLRLNSYNREVRIGEKRIDATPREVALLELLMRRLGSVVPRAAIDSALYGMEEAVTPNALEMLVSRLRKKLQDVDSGCSLHTVRGVGYLLSEE